MNRKHTREFYLELIDKFRNARNDIQFSSDFIIGYPGETDKDFEETLDLIDKVKFSNSFSFIYSQRPGTPAVDYIQISKEIAQNRLEILQNKLFDLQIKHNESKINKENKVLLENLTSKGDQFFGRNEYMQPVFVEGSEYVPGDEINVTIYSCNKNNLFGLAKN